MDAFDQTPSPHEADARDALRRDPETIALWRALDVHQRSHDERTERLRAMRLIGGDDDAA